MARFAVVSDTCVIENCRSECGFDVANITILSRWQMACSLHSSRIIGDKPTGMTALTTTADTWMFSAQKYRGRKTATARVVVTSTAFSLRRDVINLFGCCDARAMAACTIAADYAQIMEKSACEGSKANAIVARRAV